MGSFSKGRLKQAQNLAKGLEVLADVSERANLAISAINSQTDGLLKGEVDKKGSNTSSRRVTVLRSKDTREVAKVIVSEKDFTVIADYGSGTSANECESIDALLELLGALGPRLYAG